MPAEMIHCRCGQRYSAVALDGTRRATCPVCGAAPGGAPPARAATVDDPGSTAAKSSAAAPSRASAPGEQPARGWSLLAQAGIVALLAGLVGLIVWLVPALGVAGFVAATAIGLFAAVLAIGGVLALARADWPVE